MSNSLNCFKQYSELAMASYAYFDIQDMVNVFDLKSANVLSRYFNRDKFEEFFDYIYNNFFEDYYHFVVSYNFASDEQKKILNQEINKLVEQYKEHKSIDTTRLFKYSSFAVSFFKKYRVLYHTSNNKTSFSATLFEKIKSEEYSEELKDVADKIISFRGTDQMLYDTLYANVDLILNQLPVVVYTDMIDFITYCIKEHYLDQNDNIAVTGHSLGGALSQLFYATFYKDFQNIQGVYTFNSPGIVELKENIEYVLDNINLFSSNQHIYIKKLHMYLSNNFRTDRVHHFHTGNTFEYEKEIINIDNYLLNKFIHDLKLVREDMTPDELMSHFQYLENMIQNLNDDIYGIKYMFNINMTFLNMRNSNSTVNTSSLINLPNYYTIDNYKQNKDYLNLLYSIDRSIEFITKYRNTRKINKLYQNNTTNKNNTDIDNVNYCDIGKNLLLINKLIKQNKYALDIVKSLGKYAHSIISSILVLNFYNYLYLYKSNHLNGYTVYDYIKLFNIYTYQINSRLFSNDKYIVAEFSTDYSPSLNRTDTSDSYLYGNYLLDRKYNRPIIDIIKYIYLFAQAYSEHEGIEDENLHNCINSIEQILTSKIYDYSNVTIEIINILSKHNIYCKLIYDTERNEYENMNDISSKFIKYFRISFLPIYENKSMFTENTLTHIFGYNLQEMLNGCDDEFIALFPLQTVSIS